MISENERLSTAFSVNSFLACILLNLLKTLFIMFKCHFTFLLIRSLISSFVSNWTSACEAEVWLSVDVRSAPGLNTECLCAEKDLSHYFALGRGFTTWPGYHGQLFILSLPTPLHPGRGFKKKMHTRRSVASRLRTGASRGLELCWSCRQHLIPFTGAC